MSWQLENTGNNSCDVTLLTIINRNVNTLFKLQFVSVDNPILKYVKRIKAYG